MKTKNYLFSVAIIIAGAMVAHSTQAQTYGRGVLTNNGACVATGIVGNCTDTYIGDAAGASLNAASVNNTFVGAGAGNATVNGINNCFFGHNAGFGNLGSSNTFVGEGCGIAQITSYNSYFGAAAGAATTFGGYNTFIGYTAGLRNTSTGFNTFVGHQAGHDNNGITSSQCNVAVGLNSLYQNVTGYFNTAIGTYAGNGLPNNSYSNDVFVGFKAGYGITTGSKNVFVGGLSGYSNSTGDTNVFIGYNAAASNTTGTRNVCIGGGATLTTTSGNTCVGYGADIGANTYLNCGAFGNGAVNNQGSNTIMFGNAATTGIWTQLSLNTISDGRFKINVTENVKGLEFIKKLRPVTYKMDTKALDAFRSLSRPKVVAHTSTITDSTGTYITTTYDTIADPNIGIDYGPSMAMVHSGFIAQEVEQAAQGCGFKSSIVSVPADDTKSNYGLNYAEIVVPLVKAIQELDSTVTALKEQLNNATQSQKESPTGMNTNPSTDVELANYGAILYQNAPNPFGDGTIVKYFVPENSVGAIIVFYDEFGKEIKNMMLPNKGVIAELNLATMNLAAGIYSYSLIVNGKVIDTKKMMRNK